MRPSQLVSGASAVLCPAPRRARTAVDSAPCSGLLTSAVNVKPFCPGGDRELFVVCCNHEIVEVTRVPFRCTRDRAVLLSADDLAPISRSGCGIWSETRRTGGHPRRGTLECGTSRPTGGMPCSGPTRQQPISASRPARRRGEIAGERRRSRLGTSSLRRSSQGEVLRHPAPSRHRRPSSRGRRAAAWRPTPSARS